MERPKVGVAFNIDGQGHFGWIRMSVHLCHANVLNA